MNSEIVILALGNSINIFTHLYKTSDGICRQYFGSHSAGLIHPEYAALVSYDILELLALDRLGCVTDTFVEPPVIVDLAPAFGNNDNNAELVIEKLCVNIGGDTKCVLDRIRNGLQSSLYIPDTDKGTVIPTADDEPASRGVVERTYGLEILGSPDLLPLLIDVFHSHTYRMMRLLIITMCRSLHLIHQCIYRIHKMSVTVFFPETS